MARRGPVRDHVARYLLISVLFCLVCVFYLGRLFYIQISGRENSYDTDTTVKLVTVPAVRGEIYDRNGKKLVSNRYTYDLTISHSNFSKLSQYQSNKICLQLFDALDDCYEMDAHNEKYFPFDGVYPNYTLSDETAGGDSIPYYRMKRIISDLDLKESTTPQELIDYYVKTYHLLTVDMTGRRLFTNAQIDTILRLRYDMDANRFSASNDYVFASGLSQSSRLIPYVSELGIAGAEFRSNVTRVYDYPGYASHILGTVGPIYEEEWTYYNNLGYQMNSMVGKTGCEYTFESYLHGIDGVTEIEVDSSGRVIRTEVISEPVAGKNVYLTLDIDLQIAAEKGLAENVQYVVDHSAGYAIYGYGCNAGAAVAMDPDTFDILAIASYPTYNLSTYNQDYTELAANEAIPLLNRALNGLYAPGSTYKLGVAVAALMEGEIDVDSVIRCSGKYPYDTSVSNRVGCSTYETGTHRGNTGLITAIAQSCNTFFCEIGDRLGISKLENYMGRFGFGKDTGIELGGGVGIQAGPTYRQEANSPLGTWTDGETWRTSIGQAETQASPLQMACYIATLSNGGTRYSAHLLHSVYEFGKDEPFYTYTQTEETVLDRIEIPNSVQTAVFRGMKEVVVEHDRIVEWMKDVPVTVGGKTGTAQTNKSCENALFVAAAPYNDPEIVISVVLEQGFIGEYASMTAASILNAYYNDSQTGS